ncbi:histidine kinase [Glutamicibacter sp.]|uniref:sensor histidine kinase n=1 Tax=Glutamicibacter sp. TaxID=1931995 RepID=UPI0028BDFCC7|nr:histidine kinase [Glutamicibacter sp.]
MSTRRAPLVILPVAIAVIQLVGTHFAAARMGAALPPAAVLLLLAGPAVLLLRRYPGVMAVLGAAVALGYLALGFPFGPFLLSFAAALVLAVAAGARWWAWGAAAGFGAVGWLLSAQHPRSSPLLLAWLVVVLLAGELARAGRERGAERRRAAEARRRHQADEQRLVLARDIHDVVAHSLSMINVQASVALHLAAKDPDVDKLTEALGNIKTSSAQSLAEVREVLSVLRQDAPRLPGQRLAQLPDLVARVASAQLAVHYTPPAIPGWVDEPVQTAVYRIVQEALTNIVRHASATRVEISLQFDERQALVRVCDDGVGLGAADEGNGLRGMRERVQQLGGSVQIGPGAPGGGTGPGTTITASIPNRGNNETH